MPVALAIHGGAWNIPDGQVAASLKGISAALAESWESLLGGATSVDVVELAVRLLEDDPTFNAGKGSRLSSANTVELDASIMEGTNPDPSERCRYNAPRAVLLANSPLARPPIPSATAESQLPSGSSMDRTVS